MIQETISELDLSKYDIYGGDCVNIAVALQRVYGGDIICSYASEIDFQEMKPAHCAVRIDGVLYDGGGVTSEESLIDRAHYGHPDEWDDIIVREVDNPSRHLHNPEAVEQLVQMLEQA